MHFGLLKKSNFVYKNTISPEFSCKYTVHDLVEPIRYISAVNTFRGVNTFRRNRRVDWNHLRSVVRIPQILRCGDGDVRGGDGDARAGDDGGRWTAVDRRMVVGSHLRAILRAMLQESGADLAPMSQSRSSKRTPRRQAEGNWAPIDVNKYD